MDRIVEAYLRQLRFGATIDAGPLVLVPLYSAQESPLDFVSLSTALAAGSVAIREVDSAGVVGSLIVDNCGARPVLLLDGQELQGAKQNRVLNSAILVGEHCSLTIPVSCTEQGRWARVSERFEESLSPAPPRLRRMNQRAVAASLAREGDYSGDQAEVWECVRQLAEETGVRSHTSAMRDVFESRLRDLDSIGSTAACQPGQIGLLAIGAGGILGCDIVARRDVYAVLHPTLVRSYAMDALLSPKRPPSQSAHGLAMDFLGAVLGSTERRFKSIGCGEDFRYEAELLVGSSLVHSGCLVHAAFFRLPPGEEAACGDSLPACRTRAAYRKRPEDASGRSPY